jgi:hypothetical protein
MKEAGFEAMNELEKQQWLAENSASAEMAAAYVAG